MADDADVYALVDTAAATLEWVSGAHCKAHCKNGHCHTLVKVVRGDGDLVARIGHRLGHYDGLVAGVYTCRPLIFSLLERHLTERSYCTVADSMQELAAIGRLRFVDTGELSCNKHWFGHETLQAALTQAVSPVSEAVQPSWAVAALELLNLNELPAFASPSKLRSPHLEPDVVEELAKPEYDLGPAIGIGSFGEVVEATASNKTAVPSRSQPNTPLITTSPSLSSPNPSSTKPLHSFPPAPYPLPQSEPQPTPPQQHLSQSIHPSRSLFARGPQWESQQGSLRRRYSVTDSQEDARDKRQQVAVKVVRKGRVKVGEIMWEVHVMRKLRHPHIVQLLDVIDVADAVYIVMNRVDGPCLLSYIHRQPKGYLSQSEAGLFLRQLLSALRHTHDAGFVHCDVKPQNVRLTQACDSAVLVDWGFALRVGKQSNPSLITRGTPAYAAPELLTGYRGDGVADLSNSLSASVDVWALGVSFAEMLTGVPPFHAPSFDALVRNVLDLRYKLPEHIPIEVRHMIDDMLQLHPSDRASIAELCGYEWVIMNGPVPSGYPSRESFAHSDVKVHNAMMCEECHTETTAICCQRWLKCWQQPSRLATIAFYTVICSVLLLLHTQYKDDLAEQILAPAVVAAQHPTER